MEKEITVKVEQEFKVVLDMNKYNKALHQISGYWDYDSDFSDEEIIEEAVKDIVRNYLHNGFHNKELEGFPIDGQDCKKTNTYIYIEE